MRKQLTASVCSVLLLAAAHASVALRAADSLPGNPQATETKKAQETVDLKISGMT